MAPTTPRYARRMLLALIIPAALLALALLLFLPALLWTDGDGTGLLEHLPLAVGGPALAMLLIPLTVLAWTVTLVLYAVDITGRPGLDGRMRVVWMLGLLCGQAPLVIAYWCAVIRPAARAG